MALAYLLIGGNQGNREQFMNMAVDMIKEYGEIQKLSSIYETKAWGFTTEQSFLNQVIALSTSLSPYLLLEVAQKIEHELGRIRKSQQYSSRTMDVDILFYDDIISEDPKLTLPHPRLHLRKFTLIPLNEIAPKLIHPKFKKDIELILNECDDDLDVKLYTSSL
ncbi:MAG: 2-amino-4-hydroxy-6-hydroxymethyldihydropteridine diphosphokinase [Hyphomicrobiales bacterium]